MAEQVIRAKDSQGNVVDLAILGEDGGYGMRVVDTNLTPVINRFSVSTPVSEKVFNSGDTVLFTPPVGQSIRLKWIALATPETNPDSVVATVTLGNTQIVAWPLGAPGAFSHSDVWEGSQGDSLVLNLDKSRNVYVNASIEVF